LKVNIKRKENIKKYWNERALKHKKDPAATTNDVFLRKLEIKTILETLKKIRKTKNVKILDIGCADGYSTIKISQSLNIANIVGVDYGSNMIKIANKKLGSLPKLKKRVNFLVGDVSNLDDVIGKSKFDVVISDRLLINLDSVNTQKKVISEVFKHLKNGGYYIAIENFIEGHNKMNQVRKLVGLPEIPLRWHNLFLKKSQFLRSVQRLFKIYSFDDFASAYYFSTRVVYSKMCQMRREKPDYNHDIHKLSVDLPWFGEFSPVKMVVLKKKQV